MYGKKKNTSRISVIHRTPVDFDIFVVNLKKLLNIATPGDLRRHDAHVTSL